MDTGLTLHPSDAGKGGLLDQWGAWLDSAWRWDWFVTLTFDPVKETRGGTHNVVGWGLSAKAWDDWVVRVDERSGGEAYWFRGREPNPHRLGTHFHALVGGVSGLRRDLAWQEWTEPHGFARILPYGRDAQGRRVSGASAYVAKYVTKELGDLTFSRNAGLMRKGENDAGNRYATEGRCSDANAR